MTKYQITKVATKWRIIGGGDPAGWVFKKAFSVKWKAELALKLWQRQGRVSDYNKAIRAEKERRSDLRREGAYRAREAALQRFGSDALDVLSNETPITIRRQPGHYGIATVPLSVLCDFHLREISGGIGISRGRPALFARIYCNNIPEPDKERFGHSCAHGRGPHEILVCINQSDKTPDVFGRLLASARI